MKKGLFLVLVAMYIAAALAVCGCDSSKKEPVPTVYPVVVDYDMSLTEMIQAAGNYKWISDDINTKHFSITENGKVEVVFQLIDFGCLNPEEVLLELDHRNLRPATLPELLAFGAKYPEFQQQLLVVALGSVWVDSFGRRRAVSLREYDDGERSLGLVWGGCLWHGGCIFLAASNP